MEFLLRGHVGSSPAASVFMDRGPKAFASILPHYGKLESRMSFTAYIYHLKCYVPISETCHVFPSSDTVGNIIPPLYLGSHVLAIGRRNLAFRASRFRSKRPRFPNHPFTCSPLRRADEINARSLHSLSPLLIDRALVVHCICSDDLFPDLWREYTVLNPTVMS
jgi:hypothetical protein